MKTILQRMIVLSVLAVFATPVVKAADVEKPKACKLPPSKSTSTMSAQQYEEFARAAGAQDCDEVIDPDRIADRLAKKIAVDSVKAHVEVPEPRAQKQSAHSEGTAGTGEAKNGSTGHGDTLRTIFGPSRRDAVN